MSQEFKEAKVSKNMADLIKFDPSKAVEDFYAKQSAKKASKPNKSSRNQKKFLPSGVPNPEWRPRPSGKHQKKFLEDGSVNPKWKPPVINQGSTTDLIKFDPAKAVEDFYTNQSAKKASKPNKSSRNQKKFLPSGEPNPEWRPRPGGKHQKKFLEDGSVNPKWKPPVINQAKVLATANEKLQLVAEKLRAREGTQVLLEDIKRATRSLNRSTTSGLPRNALRLYALISEVAKENRDVDQTTSPTLTDLAEQIICPNCGKEFATSKLFCSELCQQEAITVRHCRRVTRDRQRCQNLDVQEGIGIELLMLFGGGYPTEARTMSEELRAQIFERDGAICQFCGAPATEIDHIEGSSNDPSNLRALCKPCNMNRPMDRAVTVTLDTDPEQFSKLEQYAMGLAVRIASPKPVKVCDDEIHWMSIQFHIRRVRRLVCGFGHGAA
ncbi:MAG: HNH endonuclease [Sulfuritalea sp.]|nr:HNH endonuclease [Sulfuritalea sp.]MDP1981998.1 HNH endonuclease [Sulfuritalea sp.]